MESGPDLIGNVGLRVSCALCLPAPLIRLCGSSALFLRKNLISEGARSSPGDIKLENFEIIYQRRCKSRTRVLSA